MSTPREIAERIVSEPYKGIEIGEAGLLAQCYLAAEKQVEELERTVLKLTGKDDRAALEAIHEIVIGVPGWECQWADEHEVVDEVRGQRCAAESAIKQRDQRISTLESALIRLRDCDWTISLPDRMDAVREIAREALEEHARSIPAQESAEEARKHD